MSGPRPTSQGEGSHAGRVAPCSTGWGLTLVLSRILRESRALTLGPLIAGLLCAVSCFAAVLSGPLALQRRAPIQQALTPTVRFAHPQAELEQINAV